MIATDMHVHSSFSSDSAENPEAIISTAISKGFSYAYFTDHHDMDFPVSPDNPEMDFQLDFDSYFEKLLDLREQYKGIIEVRIGVEQGICPETAPAIAALSNRYPFDFIIGSSHLTSLNNGDPYYPQYYHGKTNTEAYREYFASEAENVRLTDGFDVYGHLDYAVRYCPDASSIYNFKDYQDIFEVLLKRLIERGKGIEINTSGIEKIGYPHPHIEALKLYKELGGEIITIGSDAHKKENIGFGFDTAEKLLQDLGFKYYTVFKDRTAEFIKL
ncbi:MAG: histidinol-phosphatase HisJ family protein [Lachnospiraceae bacterium]|nr:histidinol-phosphatase HisJ family protein [Lachnospiraceae bacterium]